MKEMMKEMPMMKEKEEKGSGKIDSIHIRVLDDGSFSYSVTTDKGMGKEYSYQSVSDLLDAVEDDLKSPHLRKPKLGTGERFKNLTAELSRGGASSPKGLAAHIGREKYGKGKFQKLAARGKK